MRNRLLALTLVALGTVVTACGAQTTTTQTPSATPPASAAPESSASPAEPSGPPPQPDAQGQCPEAYENVNGQCLRKRGIVLVN